MTEIENEGRTYVLKSEMESIIKERIGKVASRATAAERSLEEAQSRLAKAEKAMSSVDILNQQLSDMQTKLQGSEQRFERYQSISKHGLTDPDLVEAIEWSFERAQKNKSDKERQTLSEWLDQQVDSPDTAPITIRPHLQALKMIGEDAAAEGAPMQEASTASQLQSLGESLEPREQAAAPRTNVGAIPAPDSPGFLDRALKDPEFYAANRDKVMQAWKSRNRRQS
jgi:DNA replication initiation complex subunit (GINS family)